MKKFFSCHCSDRFADYAYVVFRVVVGITFLMHGWQKIQVGMTQVKFFFTQLGIPAAGFFAPLVSYIEFIGGIAIILGLLTHWVSKLNIVIMLVAIGAFHIKMGYFIGQAFGYEYALLILVSNVLLMAMGSGKLSLDNILAKRMESQSSSSGGEVSASSM